MALFSRQALLIHLEEEPIELAGAPPLERVQFLRRPGQEPGYRIILCRGSKREFSRGLAFWLAVLAVNASAKSSSVYLHTYAASGLCQRLSEQEWEQQQKPFLQLTQSSRPSFWVDTSFVGGMQMTADENDRSFVIERETDYLACFWYVLPGT